MRTICRSLILVLTVLYATDAYSWTTWIGALEDWPQVDAAKPGQPLTYESRVRPLFVRVDQNSWHAAPLAGTPNPVATLPKTFAWDVCFSGRAEGSVTAMLASNVTSSAAPPYTLRETDRAPWRTRRSLDYAGWISEPVYKPIVLSSSMNSSCRDPEKWRAGPGDKAKKELAAMMSAANQELSRLGETYRLQEATSKVSRAWASSEIGRFAVVKGKSTEGKEIQATFFLSEKNPIFIGFNTMLIDAGDFDGDGKSDLVFKQRANKKDIYMLYNGSTKLAETTWDYGESSKP